jgi:hypothetical protein
VAITLNHTIVPAHDKEASAKFFAHIFGLKYKGAMGHFAPVRAHMMRSVFRKNRLTVTVICFLTCLFASFAFAKTPTPPPNLQSADWSVKQSKILNAEPNEVVWRFMNNLWGNDDLSPGNGKLCQFTFADLRHSGVLSLVVSYDGGGTADCNYVEIFDKSPVGIVDFDFQARENGGHFASIEDINHDGHHQLVVDKVFASGGQTGHCAVAWPVIYAWSSTGYSDVSTDYKGYYRRQLSPQGVAQQQEDEDDLDCTNAYKAKLVRFLGISRDAGMSDAIKWAESEDPHEREFAIGVLYDMGISAESDADQNIFIRSKSGRLEIKPPFVYNSHLVEIKPPSVYPTIHGQLLTPNTDKSSIK